MEVVGSRIKCFEKFRCKDCGEEYASWVSLTHYINPSDGSIPTCPTCGSTNYQPIGGMQIG